MAKKTSKKTAAAKKGSRRAKGAAMSRAANKAAAPKKAGDGTNKREICAKLLQRAGGATTKDLLEATGWPAISVPAVAKASGLTLRQEKAGRVTTYFGTPA